MSVRMPEPDREVLLRREGIVAAMQAIVPGEGVIAGEREMRPFETDGLTAYRQMPLLVVLPRHHGQVSAGAALLPRERTSRWCRAARARRCPAAPCRSPTASCSAWQVQPHSRYRFRQSLRRRPTRRHQSRHHPPSQHRGFYYAPDPSSQIACTIGGNIAENSGGVHCLKYGSPPTTCSASRWC
jgi:glycolate oxidase